MTTGAKADRPNLPRDCADLLIEFSTALHKHSMYPAGHPALADVAASVVGRAAPLLADRDQIAIGVARHQLMVEGVATDPEHPVLSRLADRLHEHQLGALSLHTGLEEDEVGAVLQLLASDSELQRPLGLRPAESLPGWRTVRLYPLTFDNLALLEDTGGDAESTPLWQGVELWLGLAQAALAGQTRAHDQPIETDPAVLARAIDAHEGTQAYDQVVMGYLLQIAQTLRAAPAGDADALRVRASGLIGAMQPETLRRLVSASQSEARQGFVRDAVRTLGVDAVLEVLKATAEVSRESISDGLTRILSKLAAHAAGGAPASRGIADEALRDQVTRLLVDWKLEDPNPEVYGRLLSELASASQRTDVLMAGDSSVDGDLRLVEMALELDDMGPLAARAVERLIGRGEIDTLLGLLANAPEPPAGAAETLRRRLGAPDAVARVLEREPVNLEALDQVLGWTTAEGYEQLLDALLASSHRGTRRKLIERLAGAPIDLTPAIAQRLQDSRWYAQRNMLHLLERTGRLPDGFSAAPWLSHDDWRVRYEAVRLALKMPEEKDLGLRSAIADPHPRIVALGLQTVGDACPDAVLPQVIALARDTAAQESVRTQALRLLAFSRHMMALTALVSVVDGGRTLFGRARLAPPDAACLAALRALARGFAGATEAKPFLALARASPVEAVRAAVAGV